SAHYVNESNGQTVFTTENTPNGLKGGFSTAIPGNRSYVNDRGGGDGLQYILLSMALNNPSRRFNYSLDNSPGYYGGMCSTVKSLGYQFDSQGRVNLTSRSPAASKFGLTDSERNMLNTFISSNGTNGLNNVINILRPYRVKCEITIVRRTEGLISWMGNETDRTGLCSRAKGGSYVAGALHYGQSEAIYLSRATRQNQPEAAETWKEGEQICEESAQQPRRCIAFPGGNNVYRIHWGRNQEIQSY
ncbi:MAG: hypothetical protein KDD25_06885, partial [Bdellovibrionales bacterium]|nr:hypothetical protein [Bdellovibrionales bacterium]